MRDIKFENAGAVNVALLDGEIKAALGAGKIAGITSDSITLTVHVTDDALKEVDIRTTLATVLKNHDASAKTPEQAAQEAVVNRLKAFIEAPEIDTRNALTNAQLTTKVAELEGLVRLLLGAREA